MKSENCDPNIVFPLVSLHTISNKLYENYEDVKEDPALTFKIGEIIRDMEKYRGIFANNCGCKHK